MFVGENGVVLSETTELQVYFPQPTIRYAVTGVWAPVRIYSDELEISYDGTHWDTEIVADLSYTDIPSFDLYVRSGVADVGSVIIDAAPESPTPPFLQPTPEMLTQFALNHDLPDLA